MLEFLIIEGDGFVSRIYRCQLEWSPPSDVLPSCVVAKAPTVDKMDALVDEAPEVGHCAKDDKMEWLTP